MGQMVHTSPEPHLFLKDEDVVGHLGDEVKG